MSLSATPFTSARASVARAESRAARIAVVRSRWRRSISGSTCSSLTCCDASSVNRFTEDASQHVKLLHVDPEIERRQRERTTAIRAARDSARATEALAEVKGVAESDTNLLPPIREALRARCTVGEVCDVLRELWGTYDARHA